MIKYSPNANNKFVIKRNIAPIAPKQLKCALHYITFKIIGISLKTKFITFIILNVID